MRNTLAGLALVVGGLLAAPGTASAFWNSVHGYGPLQSRAVNFMPGIHYHGPLYNYGPYYGGPGYNYQVVPGPHHGTYNTAYPIPYYSGQQPGQGYSVGSTYPSGYSVAPASSGVQYQSAPPPRMEGQAQQAPQRLPAAVAPGQLTSYPGYLTQPAWPGPGR